MRDGVEALSVQELIAILLVTGVKGKSVLVLAQEMLLHFKGLEGLLNATVQELMEIKGIGEAKAILLKAAFGIAQRTARLAQEPLQAMNTLESAFSLAKLEIGNLSKEALLVILRDVRGRLIHHEVVGIGTLSQVLVHPREVFNPAVRHRAHSLILAHNHPSGDPTPSTADIELTRAMVRSSQVMGIGLDDHLIVSKTSFYSMRQHGWINPQ